jgi:Activator of Hsp90 ATPase homolog 1-like protein
MAETQVHEMLIHTTPEKLWDALTNPDVTKQYFFGESIVSDWKKGSSWHSVGRSGSRDVEGTVLEAAEPRRLVLTWQVVYDPDLRDEQSAASHVANGWGIVLAGLKTLLETGRLMPMPEPAA